jgi:hypothetical protein
MLKNIDWLNSNRKRSYPFFEGSGLQERYFVGGEQNTIPNDFLVDLRLSGGKTFEDDGGTLRGIDYFLYTLERVGGEKYILTIRERRDDYNLLDPDSFEDIGIFEIPFGSVSGSQHEFIPTSSNTQIQGNLTIHKPLDLTWTVGVHEFLPEQTTFETRTIVPSPGDPIVTTIEVLGSPWGPIDGDVRFVAGDNAEITAIPSTNSVRVAFNQEILDCDSETKCIKNPPTLEQIIACNHSDSPTCLGSTPNVCNHPALMSMNKVEGNHIYTLYIEGRDGIQASALTELVTGGNPFDPSDYFVRGLVITYHGMVSSEYLGGDPDDYNSYMYGLVCSASPEGVQAVQDQVTSLEQKILNLFSQLP